MIGKTEFAVVDVETTGLFPARHDRIIEIAIVRVDSKGNRIKEYETLVNPNRDLGDTNIHGITASEVKNAPIFEEIAGDILSLLSGAVFVAHNATFDMRFIMSEMDRIGYRLPSFPYLCTMQLSKRADPNVPSRNLKKLCEHFNIPLVHAHSAYYDACAAAELLTTCLSRLEDKYPNLRQSDIGVKKGNTGNASWPTLPISRKTYKRVNAVDDIASEPSYITKIVARMPRSKEIHQESEEYVALLDMVLEDRRVTPKEGNTLFSLAEEIGLTREDMVTTHQSYMKDLIGIALEDGIITASEEKDLNVVKKLLSISEADYKRILNEVNQERIEGLLESQTALNLDDIEDKTVCFTGAFTCKINGKTATRAIAEEIAIDKGMIIEKSVVNDLDYLVAADPDSMSNKAKKARKQGTRILAEAVFWQRMGVQVE